jgi:hypothetical protein
VCVQSNELFSLFLDETMTYSCAIFNSPEEPLKDAQLRKLHAMIDKVTPPLYSDPLPSFITERACFHKMQAENRSGKS